jgi:UPF0755 protein
VSRTEPVTEMSLSEVLPGAFPPEPPVSPRRGAARKQRKRKQRRRRRAILVMILTLTLVGGAVVGSYLGLAPLIRQLNEPKDYVGAGTGAVQVKIPSGATGRTIARVLTAAGVVKTEVAFLDAAQKDPRSGGVQPGTYSMRQKMSATAALGVLLDPTARLIRTVTIPEGTRVKDEFTLISKSLGLKRADLVKASTSGAIGLPAAAQGKPEGFLFPATYDFPPDVTATEVLTKMVKRGSQAFATLNIPDSQLRAVVIKASIVQAEAGNQKYMGRVATVLDNRLRIKKNLQLDSTVSYATGKFNVTTTVADRAVESPYNTYLYAGLPAGPIGNPGEEALQAVMNPTAGPWLFFVTVNPQTGETRFAVDEAGHEANVRQFQAWLRAHPKG